MRISDWSSDVCSSDLHDGRLHCGVAGFYRNAYRGSLVQEWLPKLDGAVSKLQAGALVADVGCGHGHSTVIMAEAFPNSTFVGFDTHLDSVAEAHKIAKAAGVAGRAAFETARADDYEIGRASCRARMCQSV